MQHICICSKSLRKSLSLHFLMMTAVLVLFLYKPNHYIEIPFDLIIREQGDLASAKQQIVNKQKHYTHQNVNPHLKEKHIPNADETENNSPIDSYTSAKSEMTQTELQIYLAVIFSIIEKNKHYPKAAKLNEEEGVVEIEIEIAKDGSILSKKIVTKSVYPILNQSALDTFRDLPKLPVPPKSVLDSSIKVHIPIRFKIERY